MILLLTSHSAMKVHHLQPASVAQLAETVRTDRDCLSEKPVFNPWVDR